ncbi:MAG: hypothetical protein AMJ81_03235 [Phycisphaerae bacterium SM23_33]|nr:MAG: hypothetical protein AMJ81_03235 [Phycisphaerae bacterium SM23_33]
MKTKRSPGNLESELQTLRRRVRQLEASRQGDRGPRKALPPCEALVTGLLDASSDWAMLIDVEGTILALNEAAARGFHKSRSELVGVCSYDLFPRDLARRRRALAEEVIRTGRPARYEDRGEGSWLESTVHPIRNAQGDVTELVLLSRDITQQRQTEQALRESEQKYRFLFDAAPVGIGVADRTGKVLAANRSMLEMTGYALEEFVSTDLACTYVHPEERRSLLKTLEKSGRARDFEVTLRRKDGTTYSALLNVDLAELGGREVLFTTCRDISEHKRADEELRTQRELLGNVLRHIPYQVFWKDTRSVYLGCNQSFASAAGAGSPEGIVGKMDSDLAFDKRRARRYRVDDQQVIRTGRPLLNKEEALLGPGGQQKTVLTSKVPLRDAAGGVVGVLGICADITDVKRAHQALEESGQAERSFREKLTALHELTNELSTAGSFDELCRQAVELGRSRLGFERLGLWFVGSEPGTVTGSFGTDERGRTRDERDQSHRVLPGSFPARILRDRSWLAVSPDDRFYDAAGRPLGRGTRIAASLWDGKKIVGFLSADRLLTGGLITQQQGELLQLYASALGPLCSRKRAEESLSRREEAQRRFGEQLTALHKVTNELSMAGSFDELCRRAVDLGRSRLGFDRLGVWFRGEEPDTMRGSFGTDGNGRTCDERDERSPVVPGSSTEEILKGTSRLAFAPDEPFRNAAGKLMGRGTRVLASMWDGKRIVGFISADNLLTGQPITEPHAELLSLYASALGHLCSRKRAEEALRESKERLQYVIDNTWDILFEVDLKGNYTFGNLAAQRITGYPVSRLLKMDMGDLIAPDHRKAVFARLRKRAAGQPLTQPFTFDIIRRDGRRVTLELATTPVRRQGKLVAVQGVARDVTERQRAERELLIRNSAIHSAINPIGLAGLDGRVSYVNPSFVRMWGYRSEKEILGKRTVSFWRGRMQVREVSKALRTAGGWTGEMTAKRKNGSTFDVAVAASIVKNEGGRPICMMASFADITQRKKAEEAMRLAQRKLTVAREEERRRLAGELHDSVGQGLVALQLAIRGLVKDAKSKRPGARPTRLRATVSHCDGLVRDVRRICRGLYPPTLEALGLCSALKQAAEGFRGETSLQVNCSASVRRGRFPPEVEIALFRVGQEAISNAIRHGRAKRITLSVSHKDGRAVLSVTDNGIGFDVGKVVGKGLGMSMMTERMRAVDGELKISSRPGHTRVVARVPARLIRPTRRKR